MVWLCLGDFCSGPDKAEKQYALSGTSLSSCRRTFETIDATGSNYLFAMDPATIVGVTGAIVGMVDVLARSVKSLYALQNRWTHAQMTVSSLVSQLTALKTALGKMREWIASDLSNAAQHHQLVIDLEDSIACCQMLVQNVERTVLTLERSADNKLNTKSKAQIVFGDKAMDDFQRAIASQTSALTLLLMACNW